MIKMRREYFVLVLFLLKFSDALKVNHGIYQGLRIAVSENVPRQKCQSALDNLEVSLNVTLSFVSLVNFNPLLFIFSPK